VPAARVDVSSVVDTTAADVRAIVRLVRAYLSQPDTSARARGLWSTRDPLDRGAGDLTRFFAYAGYPATVVGVVSAAPGDSVYMVRVLHAGVDSASRRVEPWALQRLYAVRAPGAPLGWQLSNTLPRLTRGWPARTVGRIAFHYAPGQEPDAARAARAARFADSVAALFGVSPRTLDYYVAASPDEYFRAVGLDFMTVPSGPGTATGGNAIPEAGIVLAGDPSQGEAYLHEIVHAVLGRGFGGAALGEGVPIWLAGSKGRPVQEGYRQLAEYQRAHPQVTVAALLRVEAGWGTPVVEARNATAALFVDAVYRRGGVSALRALAGMPRDAAGLLAAMRARLGLPADDPAALDRWWREAAREASESGGARAGSFT
jgi:hypothetical protein